MSADTQLHKLLAQAYWLGWKNCAGWADRSDLLSDEGSGAYRGERDNDLRHMLGGLYAEASKLVDEDPERGTESGKRLSFLADLLALHEGRTIL